MTLSTLDHDRDAAGLKYVYPVVSRRAGGVSVGINLNPNNACNWRCVYCQVPGLIQGKGPEIDGERLEKELRQLLQEILHGSFMKHRVPEGARQLRDVALSGNGEPTSSPHFVEALESIGRVLDEFGLQGSIPLVVISNGSLVQQPRVQQGLRRLAELGGTLWFKLDRASLEGAARVNSFPQDPERQLARLRQAAELCPTWIQSCWFAWHGEPPPNEEQQAFLACVRGLVDDGVPVRGVLLYGLARPSQQPEAPELSALPQAWLEDFARRIEETGMTVHLSP